MKRINNEILIKDKNIKISKNENHFIDKNIDNDSILTKNRRKCPYLDTINLHLLDFDFEKICSISLCHNQNIYACLVCGKYFQGRGKNTHAYTHSVEKSHHVFINLSTNDIYCLPDNYLVTDNSLQPIKNALCPTFTINQIQALDSNIHLATDVFGVNYLPGFIGMNDLNKNNYINVIIISLVHVPPIRNFFLNLNNYNHIIINNNTTGKNKQNNLILRFGELVRKIWSPHNIKNTISPHELIQEISFLSNKKYHINKQNESIEFLTWFLNELHQGLGGNKKSNSSIIYKTFKGAVTIQTLNDEDNKDDDDEEELNWTKTSLPFLYLSLDLPPTPLFKDSQGGNIIPQIPLFTVLEKYNGKKITYCDLGKTRKKFKIHTLPPYLIFHVKRFQKNNFFIEKNTTIVNFPVKNLELKEYVDIKMPKILTENELNEMNIQDLKSLCIKKKININGCIERSEIITKIQELNNKNKICTKYNLVANICHDSSFNKEKEVTKKINPLTEGRYRVHVRNRRTEQWYEIQDLHVQETLPQLINVSESYMMIYEKKE